MAKNQIQNGDVLTLTAPYAVTSGQGLLVGSIFGVALATAAISTEVEAAVAGVWEIEKTTGTAWTVGVKMYWDNATRKATTAAAAGANALIGVATKIAAAGDTVGQVRLSGAMTI